MTPRSQACTSSMSLGYSFKFAKQSGSALFVVHGKLQLQPRAITIPVAAQKLLPGGACCSPRHARLGLRMRACASVRSLVEAALC
mmetsp:Transcript_3026/g.6569  ORF Transcript_3026/g.6569 Transcript_3026/m.6569 type:complete len:85 (+) Transcript_3026:613-867(+)